jgi:hypothetical protein
LEKEVGELEKRRKDEKTREMKKAETALLSPLLFLTLPEYIASHNIT